MITKNKCTEQTVRMRHCYLQATKAGFLASKFTDSTVFRQLFCIIYKTVLAKRIQEVFHCYLNKYEIVVTNLFLIIFCIKKNCWVFLMRTIPTAGNGESCLDPVFPTIYKFGSLHLSESEISDGYFGISGQNKVTKMCPKYLLTRYYKCSCQYKIMKNRSGETNNIQNF